MTPVAFRKLALSFPETEERSHFGKPDFRVRGKIFAGLDADGRRGVLKLPLELQAMLLQSSSTVFEPAAGAWGRSGWTHVWLAKAELRMLRQLMPEAFALVAPKRLLHAQPAARPAPPVKRPRRTGLAKR